MAFDTLADVRNLEASGIAADQANAIVVAIRESREAATKADLEATATAWRSELKAMGSQLRAEFNAGLAGVRSEMIGLRADLADLRSDMGKLRGEIFRALWVQGAGVVGIILASKLL